MLDSNEISIDFDDPLGLNKDMVVNSETGVTFKKEYLPKGLQHFVISIGVAAGTHIEKFEGKEPKSVKKILLVFESKAKRSDGKRFIKNRKWTHSMADRAIMYKDLVGLGFNANDNIDIRKLVGLNFMANVTHETDKAGNITGEKVGTFAAMFEGVPLIERETTELPDWGKVYIAESAEYKQKYPGVGPYDEAIKKAKEKAAKFANKPAGSSGPQEGVPPPQQEDDLPF